MAAKFIRLAWALMALGMALTMAMLGMVTAGVWPGLSAIWPDHRAAIMRAGDVRK